MAPPDPRLGSKHTLAVHSAPKASCLSHDASVAPSFLGFRNLMVLILVVGNLRLVIENLKKYGVLICMGCHGYRRQDLVLAGLLWLLVPCHLFLAHSIEAIDARQAQRALGRRKKAADDGKPNGTTNGNANGKPNGAAAGSSVSSPSYTEPRWFWTACAHAVNASLCLGITTVTVYYYIHHPLIGTASQLHALIVWLKICSYALTNRDLRHAYLHPEAKRPLPDLYAACPYPSNVTLSNLCYFWWCPSLCYQPVYPRTSSIRWGFVAKRLCETFSLSIFIWFASAQYAAPLLKNSMEKIERLDLVSILERLMKLSTISSVIWLAGFFAIFQSLLNALAEIMCFADREFYADWWNSRSLASFWRLWNKPVYLFMKRHVYTPLVNRGIPSWLASIIVFNFSGILHEILVGIPTHNIIGVAYAGMMFQIPLIIATLPFEKAQSMNARVIGNCTFWVSFCLVGQPLGALLYYFAWTAKYGSASGNV